MSRRPSGQQLAPAAATSATAAVVKMRLQIIERLAVSRVFFINSLKRCYYTHMDSIETPVDRCQLDQFV